MSKLGFALIIALNVSCLLAGPDQATASAGSRQDIDFEQARRQIAVRFVPLRRN